MSSSTRPEPSSNGQSSGNPLYTAASRIPLIKSHSVSIPPPIRFPSDLHPLPPDISAYFVYPFTLESYVLDPTTPSSKTIKELQQRYEDFLAQRAEEKRQEEENVLRRVAPGYSGGGIMMPDSSKREAEKQHVEEEKVAPQQERAPIDDLVDHLAALEAMGSKPVGDPTGQQHHGYQLQKPS